MPFNIGAPELIIILVIALLVVGPGKLPDVGQALGKSIREFRKASSDVQDSVRIDPAPAAPAPTAAQAPAAQAPAATAPAAVPAQAAAAEPVPNTVSEATAPNTLSQPPANPEQPVDVR
jgi:TatA/E family protein of Tat protein translocase